MRGDRTVSTVPGLCDSEIWRFTVARRPFVTCFRRVTVDLAGICKGSWSGDVDRSVLENSGVLSVPETIDHEFSDPRG